MAIIALVLLIRFKRGLRWGGDLILFMPKDFLVIVDLKSDTTGKKAYGVFYNLFVNFLYFCGRKIYGGKRMKVWRSSTIGNRRWINCWTCSVRHLRITPGLWCWRAADAWVRQVWWPSWWRRCELCFALSSIAAERFVEQILSGLSWTDGRFFFAHSTWHFLG